MSQETDLIKERLDIGEVVGEYVTLKRVGGHYKGLCPFHNEKTPSFIVSPEKGIWHCFGCSDGGDVFSFIQKVESIEFVDALKLLAERAGVALASGRQDSRDARVRLFELLDVAARFYHELLMRQAVGERARLYLAERGVQPETVTAFQLGYAPQRWDSIQSFLKRKGFTDGELLAAGLVGRSQRGTLYDRFRGRILFPIHDVQGRVVAFGGRVVPWLATGEEGKYINSPETQLYEKRRVVYNLHRAKRALKGEQPAIVVEGYMDVVMLVQAGHLNVVASSGTAFTPEQIQQLARYTHTLHFAFDADAAGLKAAEAATQAALAAGMRVATIVFPVGKDPADMVLEDSVRAGELLARPTSLVDLLLTRLRETAQATDREALWRRMLPFMSMAENPIQQGEMVQAVAAALHVPESVVFQRLAAAARPAVGRSLSPETMADSTRLMLSPDVLLLGLVLAAPDVRASVWQELATLSFLDDDAVSLYTQLQRLAVSDDVFASGSADELIARLPADGVSYAEGVRRLAEEYLLHAVDAATEARAAVRALRVRQLEQELQRLHAGLATADAAARPGLMRQFQTVAEQLTVVKRL